MTDEALAAIHADRERSPQRDERRAEIEAGPLGSIPFLPTHDHVREEPCHRLCAVWQWADHLDRVRRAPGPSSQDTETDAHLVAERAIDAYLAAIPSSRERDAEIRAETIAEVVAVLREADPTNGGRIHGAAWFAAFIERHFAAPPARNDEHGGQ